MLEKIIVSLAFVIVVTGVMIALKLIKNKLNIKTQGITSSIVKTSIKYCFTPLTAIILLIIGRLFIAFLKLPQNYIDDINHVLSFLFVALITWLIIGGIEVFGNFLTERFTIDVKDNLKARKIYTQINIFKRIIITVIIILGIGLALTTFDAGKQIGRTILVSASIISVIVGMAAQKTLGSLLAGIQLAITQPIRIDDVLIVEGEWGWVEEITLTYVVIRIWDLRRLVVPVTYFMEHPFQNWTRVSANLLGTVFLYVDYSVPIEKIREELHKIVTASPDWDKKVEKIQVTNISDRTLELRILVSAKSSSLLWNLRCEVREKLMAFVHQNYPESLPKIRANFTKN